MRRQLSWDQRQRVEELVHEKSERCGLCGNANLRCDAGVAIYLGDRYSVRLLCTNVDAAAHSGGIGLAWDYEIDSEEAARIGIG
jgi:hypothetical protein